MGCCSSCLKSESSDDPDERSPLLSGNKTSVVDVCNPNPLIIHADYPIGSLLSNSMTTKQTEHAVLSEIINNLNKDVIDVTAIDSKISSGEYMDRIEHYQNKMATLTKQAYEFPQLPSVTDNPLQVLNAPLLPYQEVEVIRAFSRDIGDAFNLVGVQWSEPLISMQQSRR